MLKELTLMTVMGTGLILVGKSFGVWESFYVVSKRIHHYEYKSLSLAKKLREKEMEMATLRSEVTDLRSQLELKNLSDAKRSTASIVPYNAKDEVNFDVFKWKPEKLLGIAERELFFKHYEKAAQFYNAYIQQYPNDSALNDKVLMDAAVASFETGKRYGEAQKHLARLIKSYPKSTYYRSAKLWHALASFHQGDKEKFIETVEDFKHNYRNTREWKILSQYYENIVYRK